MAKESWEQLLAVEHEEGVAGVYRDRDDGSYWISGSAELGGSGMSARRFVFEGLREACVYGGFLPPGAEGVHARDAHGGWSEGTVANGVWLALTRAMPLAARFEDASGAIVPRPLVAREREPAPDAAAPCSACGSTAWDVALLAPGERAVVCRRCGHRVGMGVWYAGGGGKPMDPQPPDDWRQHQAHGVRHVFSETRFPVYGVAAWEGERSWRGHGTSLGRVVDVILAHGGHPSVEVATGGERSPDGHRRRIERALLGLLVERPPDREWHGLSPAALTVLFERNELAAGERVAAVVPCELTIAVDGRPRRFRAGRYGERWAAVAELDGSGELTVMITADGIPPEAVALERVTDVEPYLGEPRS